MQMAQRRRHGQTRCFLVHRASGRNPGGRITVMMRVTPYNLIIERVENCYMIQRIMRNIIRRIGEVGKRK